MNRMEWSTRSMVWNLCQEQVIPLKKNMFQAQVSGRTLNKEANKHLYFNYRIKCQSQNFKLSNMTHEIGVHLSYDSRLKFGNMFSFLVMVLIFGIFETGSI